MPRVAQDGYAASGQPPEPSLASGVSTVHTRTDVSSARRGAGAASGETLEQAVASALRKELLTLWAEVDPASLSIPLTDSLVALLAPPLAKDMLAAAVRRLPGTFRGVGLCSLLPEVASRSLGGCGPPQEHAELFDELRGFLGSHDLVAEQPAVRDALKRDIAAKLQMSHPWQRWLRGGCSLLMPVGAVLSLCAVLTPAFLAASFAVNGGSSAGGGAEGGSDCDFGEEPPQAGSAKSLAASRRCRRRIFALERELIAREKAEKERIVHDHKIRTQAHKSLMDINASLGEKLKARSEEVKYTGQRAAEAQSNLEVAQAQLADRNKEVMQLKYQLAQELSVSKGMEVREKEHSRALLRTLAREGLLRDRNLQRREKLQQCTGGEDTAALLHEVAGPERDQVILLADRLEVAFERKLAKRREIHEAALKDWQVRIEKKRLEYREICSRLQEVKVQCGN